MQSSRKYCLLCLLTLAVVAFAQTAAPPKAKPAPKPANEIRTALKAGGQVVVVVQASLKAGSSEAYADWASYLKQFAARSGPSVHIVKLSPKRYSELVTSPKLKDSYNTLFLRDAANALLYRGMILEPDVYRIGATYMTGQPGTPPPSRDGLEEVKLQVRP
jgi:hypothetical protein